MPKTNCNIIKDLLPSYLDELCSPESKQLLEEHFKECKNCQKLYEQNKLELLHPQTKTTKEVDYFKTIKTTVNKKNRSLLLLAGILFFLQLYLNFDIYRISSELTMYINYIFPVLIAGALFTVLPDFADQPVPNKIKLPLLGVEFALTTYILVLLIIFSECFSNDTLPFGLKPEHTGPFLAIQIVAFAIIFIVVFIVTLILSLRKKMICPALCFVPIGGFSIMLEELKTLHKLSTQFEASFFVLPYVVIILEISLFVGIYMFVNREKH